MNSVTGESGPVNTDRPKPIVSHKHKVPDRVEWPGPVTPLVGSEGAHAPCGEVAFASGRTPRRQRVLHMLHDGHTLHTSLTPSTREALARVATHTLGKGDTPCLSRRAHPIFLKNTAVCYSVTCKLYN
jgi:hypothetical protein